MFRPAVLRKVPRGEVICASDQPPRLYLLTSGFVKRYFIMSTGNLGVQAYYGPGDIFPFGAVFKALFDQNSGKDSEVYYYEAMTKVQVNVVDIATVQRVLTAQPALYLTLLQTASSRFHSHVSFMENLRLPDAYHKTAHQLAYFGWRFGETTATGVQLTVPITHQDIADSIGTTRETVTTSIIKLRRKKLIKTKGKVVIINYDKLIQEAYS